jgi:hypothetical protein
MLVLIIGTARRRALRFALAIVSWKLYVFL